jgi:hypothetical protein
MENEEHVINLTIGKIIYRDPTREELTDAIGQTTMHTSDDDLSVASRSLVAHRNLGFACLLRFEVEDLGKVRPDDLAYIVLGMFLTRAYRGKGEA